MYKRKSRLAVLVEILGFATKMGEVSTLRACSYAYSCTRVYVRAYTVVGEGLHRVVCSLELLQTTADNVFGSINSALKRRFITCRVFLLARVSFCLFYLPPSFRPQICAYSADLCTQVRGTV